MAAQKKANFVNSEKTLISLYKSLGNLKYDFRNYNLIKLVIAKIKGKIILDIGCGRGFLIDVLNKKGKKTFGIEPNKELIRLAKKNNPNLNIIKGKAEDIDKCFKKKVDTITMVDVLEHIKDDDNQIKKVYKHLNKKSQLILVVPAFPSLYGKRDKNMGHYRRYSKKKLIDLIKKKGFKNIKIRYWNMLGFLPYFISEKILKKELNTKLRTNKKKSIFARAISTILNFWFCLIENNINFGFGLSLICIAEKN